MLARAALSAGRPRMGRRTGKCTSTTAVSTHGQSSHRTVSTMFVSAFALPRTNPSAFGAGRRHGVREQASPMRKAPLRCTEKFILRREIFTFSCLWEISTALLQKERDGAKRKHLDLLPELLAFAPTHGGVGFQTRAGQPPSVPAPGVPGSGTTLRGSAVIARRRDKESDGRSYAPSVRFAAIRSRGLRPCTAPSPRMGLTEGSSGFETALPNASRTDPRRGEGRPTSSAP